jgi:hypothetical protein
VPRPFQIVIIVDLQGTFTDDEVTSPIPESSDRICIRLSTQGAPRIDANPNERGIIDWGAIGRAIESAVRRGRAAAGERTAHVYVAGQGPLPVFVHLGYLFSKFAGPQWVVARRPGSTNWELFAINDAPVGAPILTATPLPTSARTASGQVALYIDTAGRAANQTALYDAIERTGERVADIVELRSTTSIIVEPSASAALTAELAEQLSALPALYPRAKSIGLFVAGPTLLAYAVGHAINPTVVPTVQLFNYAVPKYELVYTLPFINQARPTVPMDDASTAKRAALETELVAAIEQLQKDLTLDELAEPLDSAGGARFLDQLRRLKYTPTESEQFSLSVASGTFSLGRGLLHALRDGAVEQRERFTKILLVHELLHEQQGIRSSNYFEIGRAGVVLESIDMTADLFALRVLTKAAFRQKPATTPEAVRDTAQEWLDAVLYGIQAFDSAEHGIRINELADRRLRRYLTWHLQRVRAEYVDSAEDVQMLLAPMLTAELAPVTARIDRRFDRIVIESLSETEFFAAIDGNLVRHSKRAGFDPGLLIDAVRNFNTQAVQQAMRFVAEENQRVLMPWLA